jgi:hypothetical protein
MSLRVLPTVRAPAAARKFVGQAITAWGLPTALADASAVRAGALTLKMLRRERAALIVTVERARDQVVVRVTGPSVAAHESMPVPLQREHPPDGAGPS